MNFYKRFRNSDTIKHFGPALTVTMDMPLLLSVYAFLFSAAYYTYLEVSYHRPVPHKLLWVDKEEFRVFGKIRLRLESFAKYKALQQEGYRNVRL